MLAPLAADLGGDDRTLDALARTRALGLHFLGHYLSVCAVENGDGGTVLRLLPPRAATEPGDGRAASALELSVLADLASGSAIRSVLGPGLRLGTTHLSLDHLRAPEAGPLEARARVAWHDTHAGEGNAACEISDSTGRLVAVSSGWFVALPPPPGQRLPPVPWESDGGEVARLSPESLDTWEQKTFRAVREARARATARGTSLPTALVSPPQPVSPGAEVRYPLPNTPALGNRVRQMQGGALYGAAAAAGEAALGSGWSVATGVVQFLRPVDAPEVEVAARVLRRGRRVAFTEVGIVGAGREALAARFTHRPSTV